MQNHNISYWWHHSMYSCWKIESPDSRVAISILSILNNTVRRKRAILHVVHVSSVGPLSLCSMDNPLFKLSLKSSSPDSDSVHLKINIRFSFSTGSQNSLLCWPLNCQDLSSIKRWDDPRRSTISLSSRLCSTWTGDIKMNFAFLYRISLPLCLDTV